MPKSRLPDGSEGDTWVPEVSGLAPITTAEGCEEEIAVDVTTIAIDTPNLGTFERQCPGEMVTLDAGNPGAQFSWSSGGFGQVEFVVELQHEKEVTVNVQGCSETASMQVNWFDSYVLDLGGDVVACVRARPSSWMPTSRREKGLAAQFQWQGGPADAFVPRVSQGNTW